MKTLVATLVIVLFSSSFCEAQETTWQADLSVAAQQAAIANKPVLLHFSADWCRDCRQIDTFVFPNPSVDRAIDQHVIPFRVNVDQYPGLVKKHSITSVPTDLLITADGRVLVKQNSPRTADDYIRLLEKIPVLMSDLNAAKYGPAKCVNEILSSAEVDPQRLLDRNDFSPSAPFHNAPESSVEGQELQRHLVGNSTGFKAEQFSHSGQKIGLAEIQQASNEHQREIHSEFQKTGPQRIVNQTYLPEGDAQKTIMGFEARGSAKGMSNANSQTTSVINPFVIGTAVPKRETENASHESNQSVGIEALTAQQNASNPTRSPATNERKSAGAVSSSTGMRNSVGAVIPQMKGDHTSHSKKLSPADNGELNRFALLGFCPVTLAEASQWVAGDSKFGINHRGKLYRFANEKCLSKFKTNPDFYSPVLTGFDPVVFHDTGMLVEGRVSQGVFMGDAASQQIVLFQSESNRLRFQKAPEVFLQTVRVAMGRGVPVESTTRR